MLARLAPSRLGTVEDVNGSTIGVKLADDVGAGLLFVRGEGYRVGQVGSFVRIPAGYMDLFGIVSQVGASAVPEGSDQTQNRWLRVELVGEGHAGGKFERGISMYPSIGDSVHVVTESDLRTVYAPGESDSHVPIGRVASAESIPASVDLNRLVNRHCAIVGSTGAGKSNAVANILSAVSDPDRFKAARVVLFDLHGEYVGAFGDRAKVFRIGANPAAGERELQVPFWALTEDEFISIAMGGIQGPQRVVIQEHMLAAKMASKAGGTPHGLDEVEVTCDTPLPFSVFQLWYDLYSLHRATHTVNTNQNQSIATRAYAQEGSPPTAAVGDAQSLLRPKFQPIQDKRIYKGRHADIPMAYVETLEGKLRDPRMRFLFQPGPWSVNVTAETEADLSSLFEAWVGAQAPITVFDLSAVPTSVIDDLVGSVLRILYDALYWGREMREGGRYRPLLVVLEEAHRYVGKDSGSRAANATRRIAKEGRKYGIGLALVSQRPSEIDSTILSQCGTIAALRLTNESDKSQITASASDNLKGLFSMLPILRTGEALITGEAVTMPIRVLIDRAPEEGRPRSDDPLVVVPVDDDGRRVREGGWTELVDGEDYRPLVTAWRKQDTKAGRGQGAAAQEPPSQDAAHQQGS